MKFRCTDEEFVDVVEVVETAALGGVVVLAVVEADAVAVVGIVVVDSVTTVVLNDSALTDAADVRSDGLREIIMSCSPSDSLSSVVSLAVGRRCGGKDG